MIWAIISGFLIGSIPSADLMGRLRGLELRSSGSGNPGTANALRVGGKGLAAAVLALDLIKGAGAAAAGWGIAGHRAGIAAAIAAIAGQIRTPWYRLRGGKGLGVAAGTTLVLWPYGLAVIAPVIGLAARPLRAAGAALLGLALLLTAAVLWAAGSWSTAWGIPPDDGLVWYAIGIAVFTAPKLIDSLGRSSTD